MATALGGAVLVLASWEGPDLASFFSSDDEDGLGFICGGALAPGSQQWKDSSSLYPSSLFSLWLALRGERVHQLHSSSFSQLQHGISPGADNESSRREENITTYKAQELQIPRAGNAEKDKRGVDRRRRRSFRDRLRRKHIFASGIRLTAEYRRRVADRVINRVGIEVGEGVEPLRLEARIVAVVIERPVGGAEG
ncbi:Clathrin light chain 1 [Senna tora]|uniref:Clathrin light chain 1 n=1 Tax=Senna tora TaxID=362788 RepID=A0A834XHJ8_9FABA|nr:Clathrin light chain 1 [Senna tora]